MSITLRNVLAEDEAFLFKVYAATRIDEMGARDWDANQQEFFLRMQFNSQQLAYQAQHPQADHHIILLSGQLAGRMIVERRDDEIRGVDLAVLPEYQKAGIGTFLIQNLLGEAEAAGKPFRIQVVKSNPANRLYSRLGLKKIGESGSHYMLEWRCGS